MSDEILRLGVLGASPLVGEAILSPARALDQRVVCVASRDSSRANRLRLRAGNVEGVRLRYEDVLRDSEVNAVYVPLPNSLHLKWVLAALHAGKHVLVEKPSVLTAREARTVRDEVLRTGLVYMEAMHYGFHPAMRLLRGLVERGAVGPLRQVEIVMQQPAPPEGDIRWSASLGGGSLLDLGCYALHMSRRLAVWLGDRARLGAVTVGRTSQFPGLDVSATIRLDYDLGFKGWLQLGMVSVSRRFEIRLTGVNGSIFVPNFVKPHEDDRLILSVDGEDQVFNAGRVSTYECQLAEFARRVENLQGSGSAVRSHFHDVGTSEDALSNAEMIDSCFSLGGLRRELDA